MPAKHLNGIKIKTNPAGKAVIVTGGSAGSGDDAGAAGGGGSAGGGGDAGTDGSAGSAGDAGSGDAGGSPGDWFQSIRDQLNPSAALMEEIQSLVQGLRRLNVGILITDHNVRETLASTDRAYVIHRGQILREGTADELVADQRVREVYLGHTFDAR